MTNKYVLTGAPGAGKSTLLARLGDLGFYKVKEVAEYVKELRTHQGRPTAEFDRAGFQKEVLQTQIRWEKEIPLDTQVAFLDRGLYDGIPYYEIDGNKAPQELWSAARSANYAGVFYLQPGKAYRNTKVRPETPQRAQELGERTLRIYEETAKSLTRIPPISLQHQVLMVLDQVQTDLQDRGVDTDYFTKIRERV